MRLADRAWPDVPEGALVVVPVGSLEQHGPHLPLDTDTVIASAVAEGVVRALDPATALLAPAVAFGASGEHEDFPGTVSIGTSALEHVIVELGRSLARWAARVVLVNGHGGNAEALDSACAVLRHEGRDAAWLPCRHGDIHAGRGETSLMLRLAPARVRLDRATAGASGDLAALLPSMRRDGVRAVSESGVIGDPSGASADEGDALLAAMIERARSELRGPS